VLAALRARRRTPHVLYVQERDGGAPAGAAARKDARALDECLALARDAGAALRRVPKHDLNMLAGGRPHQGLLLDCSALEWEPLDRLPDAPARGGGGGGGGAAEAAADEGGGGGGAEAAADEGGEAAEVGPSAGSDGRGGGGGARHPVWLALDEVVDPVRGRPGGLRARALVRVCALRVRVRA
jgi:tRNA G18 (ribose-2'-O)-methylase SpoU